MILGLLNRIQNLIDQGCPDRIEHMRGNCKCGAKDLDQSESESGCGSACGCGSSCKCEKGKCTCGMVQNFNYEAPTIH